MNDTYGGERGVSGMRPLQGRDGDRGDSVGFTHGYRIGPFQGQGLDIELSGVSLAGFSL